MNTNHHRRSEILMGEMVKVLRSCCIQGEERRKEIKRIAEALTVIKEGMWVLDEAMVTGNYTMDDSLLLESLRRMLNQTECLLSKTEESMEVGPWFLASS